MIHIKWSIGRLFIYHEYYHVTTFTTISQTSKHNNLLWNKMSLVILSSRCSIMLHVYPTTCIDLHQIFYRISETFVHHIYLQDLIERLLLWWVNVGHIKHHRGLQIVNNSYLWTINNTWKMKLQFIPSWNPCLNSCLLFHIPQLYNR